MADRVKERYLWENGEARPRWQKREKSLTERRTKHEEVVKRVIEERERK